MQYQSEIPTKLDKESMDSTEWIKARTQELYDMLPLTSAEDRKQRTDIRDELLEINKGFLGFVAKSTYIADENVTYDDKFQSARLAFCEHWWKYKFVPKYRADYSFSVFFKQRLSECIKRELNPIKYSLRRNICMKAAKQVGKKSWGDLTKEDLKLVELPPNEMRILELIFNGRYSRDIDAPESQPLVRDTNYKVDTIDHIYTEDYDEVEDLIVHEMIEAECKLTDGMLLKMSKMYGIPYEELLVARPIGEAKLKHRLEEALFINETFESASKYGTDGDGSDDED